VYVVKTKKQGDKPVGAVIDKLGSAARTDV
jgi:hypothetical protein